RRPDGRRHRRPGRGRRAARRGPAPESARDARRRRARHPRRRGRRGARERAQGGPSVSATPRVLGALALLLLVLTPVADARTWAWLGVRIRDLSEQEMEELSKRHGIVEGFG